MGASQVRSWSHWCVLGAILWACIAKSDRKLLEFDFCNTPTKGLAWDPIWHLQDSQDQIMAVAFSYKPLKTCEVFPHRSEAVGAIANCYSYVDMLSAIADQPQCKWILNRKPET